MDEVESIFTQHFANNDRKRAMKFLRPKQNKDSHMVTFLVGNIMFLSLSFLNHDHFRFNNFMFFLQITIQYLRSTLHVPTLKHAWHETFSCATLIFTHRHQY